jgi:hypothetical protein
MNSMCGLNPMKDLKSIFRRAFIFALFLVILLIAAQAQANFTGYSTRSDFLDHIPWASKFLYVETWDEFSSGYTFTNGTPDPATGITYNSSTGEAMVTDLIVDSTDPNTLGRTGLGYFNPGDSITFDFATPILAFGIDISTASMVNGTYKATTAQGVALSGYDAFPGYDTGQFVGFISDVPITSVTIALTDPNQYPYAYTLDTMLYGPLPPSLLLFGSGLACRGLLRLRKLFKA